MNQYFFHKNNIVKQVLIVAFLLHTAIAFTQKTGNFFGAVIDSENKPIAFASVWFTHLKKGIATNENGEFAIKVPLGKHEIEISCLGYARIKTLVTITKKKTNQDFVLKIKSYTLENVTITAKQNKENSNTTYEIDSDAIEHTQVTSLNDIMSLLPGEQTFSKELIRGSGKRISLRSEQTETDAPDFGTAIEIDGIRLSNNAFFPKSRLHTKRQGIDTRIIDPNSIEKVKIISGIPSVEYGDFTAGLVKIKTKQGVMPISIRASSTPRQKQLSASKGFNLGNNIGVLNLNYDFTESIGNSASPYVSYMRNAFTIKHTKTFFNNSNTPLAISTTLGGNIGGYNSEADPDEFKDSYIKKNAFNIRGGINANWQVNRSLLSAINLATSINYSDEKYERFYYNDTSSNELAFHGTQEGYVIGQLYQEDKPLFPLQLIPRGFWSQTEFHDSKPLNYRVKLKLQKNIFSKNSITNFKLGANFSGDVNKGKGIYYANRAYTPTWREHKYSQEPILNNLGLYAEAQFKYKFTHQQAIKFTAGLRNDYTFVKDARYNNVNAFSPRFNLRHTLINKPKNKYVKKMSWYAGWGESVKLPSFATLYTRPTYKQRLAFVPGALADGTTYYAYHIKPSEVIKNENLVWQKSQQFEIGVQGKIKGLKFSIAYFNKLGLNGYTSERTYTPMTYYLTTPYELLGVKIPYEYRKYSINQQGTVTVHDNRGVLPSEVLNKIPKNLFKAASYASNGTPVKRHGLEWILDFGKIKPLHTSLRLDGKYYSYKYVNTKITSDYLTDNQLMGNGEPYQYIGYYYGNDINNGLKTKRLNTNATFITHIPKIRLIISLKLEGTFVNTTQKLSEMPDGTRVFPIKDKGQTFPVNDGSNIYDGNHFAAMYPLYYSSFNNPNTKIPFAEKYAWAYKNDKELYNDLTKMIKTSNYTFHFKQRSVSSYFSANVNVSKEIGKRIKLTFYATNFFNTMAKVKYNQEEIKKTLLNNGLVPTFSYGLSAQVKI